MLGEFDNEERIESQVEDGGNSTTLRIENDQLGQYKETPENDKEVRNESKQGIG